MKLVHGRILVAALVGLALFGSQAGAQTIFGAPTVSVMQVKPTSVRLSVHGGDGGAPVGFAVEWMKRTDFDAVGWPETGVAAPGHGDFTGTPTWVVQGNAGDFTLTASQWQAVQIGELFDETGVGANNTSELAPNTEYAVRAYVLCNTGDAVSLPSPTMFITTSAQVQNCTFTIGYWKTHPSAWPATSLTLGTVTYSAADLLSILNQPAGGNGLLILAHQLIAAKLSILNGADGSAVAADIASADALIGGLVCPPVGSGSLPSSSVTAIATDLDNYNNGLIGPGHCASTPAHVTTWGSVKADYRR